MIDTQTTMPVAADADLAACLAPVPLPDHRIALPGSEWTLWRCLGLRGTGFPVAQVLKLAVPASARAAEHLLDAERLVQRLRDGAIQAVNSALDHIRRHEQWDTSEQREPLVAALRRLHKDDLTAPFAVDDQIQARIAELRAAGAECDAARAAFQQSFRTTTRRLTQVIREIAADDRFREAIIWQNRQAFRTGVEALLRRPPDETRGSKQRQQEELIANYVQRYCVKNDTIGFFGPVGWATFVDHGPALTLHPGADLLTSRELAFEWWCIDVLAETLAKDSALKPWLAPRRMPFIYVDGTTLYHPNARPSQIPLAQAVVLAACDGSRTAQQIADSLVQTLTGGLYSTQAVYQILDLLSNKGLISWKLEVPLAPAPERILRRLLERIGDESLRNGVLSRLATLESAHAAVSRSAGDPAQLDAALGELEQTFTALTETAATRGAGKTYAGRTIVYEDCRRNVEAQIGPQLLEALGPPLGLLLASARWLTWEAAALYRVAFKRIYWELVSKTGSTTIDFGSFWYRCQPILFGDHTLPVETLLPMFQRRWAEIFAVQPGQRRLDFTSAQLQPLVQAAFDAPRPGWQAARYHSPDILIDATDIDAIRRDDYRLVMGEMHAGSNTLRGAFFVAQHPDPEQLFHAIEHDFPAPRLVPIPPKQWPSLTSRTLPALVSPKDLRVVLTHDTYSAFSSQVLPISELVVEDTPDGLVARSRDGRMCFDIVEAFGDALSVAVINCFKLLPAAAHSPRITIDRLIVCRETWRVPAEAVAFAVVKDEAERFLAARRWRDAQAMPRFVFVKVQVEVKPFFVDFDSPTYINILAKAIRRTVESGQATSPVTIVEMIPDPDHAWLRDGDDQRYTSELRIVAVDPAR